MKKITKILFSTLLGLTTIYSHAFAEETNGITIEKIKGQIPEDIQKILPKFDNIFDLILAIFTFAYTIAGIICVGFIIFGGYQYITSSGNDEKAKAGSKAVTNAAIGLVIVLAAVIIKNTVLNVIGYK